MTTLVIGGDFRARLVFDSETSGLWRNKLADNHPSQPHLLQLSARLVSAQRRRLGSFTFLIKPTSWQIETEAEEKHGISHSTASRYGVPVIVALSALEDLANGADVIVAHNAEFDRKIVRLALERDGFSAEWWRKRAADFYCTMEHAAPIMGLKGPIPGVGKYPSLEESHAFFFPEASFVSRHDAGEDTAACEAIYWELYECEKEAAS